jgi:GH25 family lysozyme M1 (1,4-beta-N-acetylmuramidase)
VALNGIDVSSYQATLNLALVSYDFVLIKATEGLGYVNPYCDQQFQAAKAQGKKIGVYHYADGNDPVAEANYFVDNCKGYIHEAIFMLDWEGEGTQYTQWALTFLRQVEARIGYKPVIYMSEYVVNAYDWSAVVAGDYGLVAAKYSDYEIDNNYDMSHAGKMPDVKWWDFYLMWQWTSKGRLNGYAGDLDCDIFYGDGAAWDKYAGRLAPAPVPGPPDPTPAPTTTTTTEAPPASTTSTTTEPAPSPTTTTTTQAPSTTTTTTVVPEPPVSLWVALWTAFMALINFLGGKK